MKRPDQVLINALLQAHRLIEKDATGLPRLEASPVSPYHHRLVRLAFLAPALQRSILDGTQPPGLTLQHLMDTDIPAGWSQQAAMLARLADP